LHGSETTTHRAQAPLAGTRAQRHRPRPTHWAAGEVACSRGSRARHTSAPTHRLCVLSIQLHVEQPRARSKFRTDAKLPMTGHLKTGRRNLQEFTYSLTSPAIHPHTYMPSFLSVLRGNPSQPRFPPMPTKTHAHHAIQSPTPAPACVAARAEIPARTVTGKPDTGNPPHRGGQSIGGTNPKLHTQISRSRQ
jgi:hypothetical protein